MSKCIYYVNLYCCAAPPGKQPLAEGGYPVEIKVNHNNNGVVKSAKTCSYTVQVASVL